MEQLSKELPDSYESSFYNDSKTSSEIETLLGISNNWPWRGLNFANYSSRSGSYSTSTTKP